MFKIRVFGIDTCELKNRNPLLRQKAIAAKNRVLDLIRNGNNHLQLEEKVFLVYLKCRNYDKYGRLLCDVFCESNEGLKNLAEQLIFEKLAYRYDGGRKWNELQQLTYLCH
jgi:endonuclease YncB( thermonuclease family)